MLHIYYTYCTYFIYLSIYFDHQTDSEVMSTAWYFHQNTNNLLCAASLEWTCHMFVPLLLPVHCALCAGHQNTAQIKLKIKIKQIQKSEKYQTAATTTAVCTGSCTTIKIDPFIFAYFGCSAFTICPFPLLVGESNSFLLPDILYTTTIPIPNLLTNLTYLKTSWCIAQALESLCLATPPLSLSFYFNLFPQASQHWAGNMLPRPVLPSAIPFAPVWLSLPL